MHVMCLKRQKKGFAKVQTRSNRSHTYCKQKTFQNTARNTDLNNNRVIFFFF